MIAAVSAASPHCLEKAVCPITINGSSAQVLVDTGSSDSFVSNELVQKHKWHLLPSGGCGEVSMAATSLTSKVLGSCKAHIKLSEDQSYDDPGSLL